MQAIPNGNLTWEKTKIFNVGVDFGLANNRFTGTVEYFHKKTEDILIDLPAPLVNGNATIPRQNAGIVVNKGVEISLGWQDKIKDFSYFVNGNITFINNKVTKFKGNESAITNADMIKEGYSINVQYGYVVDRIVQTQQDLDFVQQLVDNTPIDPSTGKPKKTFPSNRPELGDLLYKDLNGDGVINSLDERPIGYREDSTPILNFGLNFSFGWKGFDLAFDFTGGAMGSWYQQWEQRNPFHDGGNNPQYYMEDTWRLSDIWDADSELIPGKYPMLLIGNSSHSNYWNSTFWKKNVRYVKLRNLELGYTLPKHIVEKALISDLRFYVAGTNLLTFTNAPGIDPESTEGNGLGYPTTRIINIGVNLKF